MRPLAVFDIDGVLADVRHRVHHIEGARKDWDAFFAGAAADPPLAEGLLLAAESAKDCDVAYVTGRPERCRSDTLAWLARHGLPEGRLEMRREGDRRPAVTAKSGLLARVAKGRVVAAVVDDDPAVCRAYERAGYRVIRATWASRPASLRRAQGGEGRT